MTSDRAAATNLAKARAAWGDDIPDWVIVLAQACDATSQTAAARRLDISNAQVSQVLGCKYGASTAAIEQRVRGAYMAATVDCPVVGPLAADACLTHQRAPWAPHNPQRIAFYRACRGCPHANQIGGTKDAE